MVFVRRRAEEGHAAHRPQRPLARRASNQGRPIARAPGRIPGPGGDNSNSQFAVLALYDAQRVGVEVSRETWELAADYWRSTQNDDGSWGYVPGDAGTGSMTCAGIGGLAIVDRRARIGRRHGRKRPRRSAAGRTKTTTSSTAPSIGSRSDFSVNHNPRPAGGGQSCLYYYLYGLERAGRLTARRFIGDHDWYREGAEFLVREQDSLSHYWKGNWHAEQQAAHQHGAGAVVPLEGSPARSSWPS